MKNIATNGVLLLCLLTLSFSCRGPQQREVLDQAPPEVGSGQVVSALPTAIWSIYQDDRAHYWFGSNGEGVFHYDGSQLRQFTTQDGLAGDQIRGIQGDQFGQVFFDTPDGVSSYDGHTFTTLEPIYSATNEWKSSADDLWFRMSGDTNGVYRFAGDSLFHLAFPTQDLEQAFGIEFAASNYSPYGVYSVYRDRQGNMWFGTLSAGVFRFDGESFRWIAEKELTVLEDGRVPGVRSIIEDQAGDFWLSNTLHRYRISESDSGTVTYDKLAGISVAEGQPTMDFPYFMSALRDQGTGDLWMLTYSEGIWRYDGHQLYHYPIQDGETEVLLFALYQDQQGTIWLGTHNAGVYRYDGRSFERFQP